MNSIAILKEFGFYVAEEQESIYPFSPVYKLQDYIIKKTQYPLEKARKLVRYTKYLQEKGIPVVTPVSLTTSNPKQIEDACYICYPFINGSHYQGTEKEIIGAGELLGRIHALSSSQNTFDLSDYNVFDFYHHEVDDHMKKISDFVSIYQVNIPIQKLKDLLHTAVKNQEKLKKTSLKWVETPHDYKANNLVFQSKPVLIDPDNAVWIPRTFDLALALLLFHNEFPSAPDRTFTPKEWKLFLAGYLKHQILTNTEIKAWEETVLHVFLDEVMWLMAEVEEDWERKEQRDLFVSVTETLFHIKDYPVY
ncbi:phosphotransferase [Oceanobacillus sp. CFH 90083]|uniref:phosphotransferase n=1 Tax=Oceanobacillus sp. CFH 90083 TaxID=2592336 RepID=UPI00128DBA26|nr:phosphotransferase [Oceanobacillus sp. CFH 90083]